MTTSNPPPAMPTAPPPVKAPSPTASLLSKARTVTGNNLKGTVRIVSLKELENTIAEAAKAQSLGHDEVNKAKAEAKRVADLEAAARAEAEAQKAEVIRLGNLAAELESKAKAADKERAEAVAAAEQRLQVRIKELETIIASDDARTRVAFLEAEVQRLSALIDRYETGLEFVTSIERPDCAADLAFVDGLKGKINGPLAARLDHIKAGIQRAQRTVEEGLKLINEQKKGTLYGCTDLLEQALALGAYHQELLTLKQALP